MLLLKICQSVASRSWVLSPVQQHVRTRMMLFTSHCSAQWCRISTLQKSLLAKVSRSYSRGMPRLPLDAENLSAMITKDVTVFTYRNNRYFLMLSIFGGMQFLFWANLAIFIKSDPTTQNSGKADATLRKNYSSWMSKFYAENRTKIAATCFALGCVMLLFTTMYPLRSVSHLTLLKGGNKLGVTTYWHFGRTRYLTVPLDDVSCTKSRTSSPTYVAMKIRGHWMYFLLDTRDGKFHEPEIFDYVIGLNRKFK